MVSRVPGRGEEGHSRHNLAFTIDEFELSCRLERLEILGKIRALGAFVWMAGRLVFARRDEVPSPWKGGRETFAFAHGVPPAMIRVEVRVRDGGPGMSHQALKDYRQRLHRGDHSSRSGAGLGLAIVSRIMEAHGGTLRTDPDRTELVLEFGRSA